METITFIGNGNMALSIAQGLCKEYTIEVAGRSIESMENFEEKLGVRIEKNELKDFDISNKKLILCVKPYNIVEVGQQLHGKAKALYSVLAGTSLDTLRQYVSSQNYIRTMPNLAASVGGSLTTFTGDEELKDEAIKLLSSIGQPLWLETEKELDIATAVAGSGPAYLALVHEALCDGAVMQGMKRDEAVLVANGLFNGFGKLITNNNNSEIKNGVMSPGGTTAAAYSKLEENSVRSAFIKAVEAAYNTTKGK
jgi:pyrroline-5-carboxylate reductase